MLNQALYQQVNETTQKSGIDIITADNSFYTRFIAGAADIFELYMQLYEHHPRSEDNFQQLLQTITLSYKNREAELKQKDEEKLQKEYWFLSNELNGMSLYVDRFCVNLKNLSTKLDYFEKLGVNFLHLMPIFESPEKESDGGYAVADFRKVDKRFGSLDDLKALQKQMRDKNFFLMLDIVLNHTSNQHEWAQKAKQGDEHYQDYYYFYHDRSIPDQYDQSMPEIFPETSPGNFTYIKECDKWVMTVFHNYQWDLNYNNPHVLVEMLDTVFFYANLGVDVLRIDAPAFIWKQMGTTCQNLPQAHTVLRLIKQCVQVAAPGMALLGEAIVAPKEIMKYFGENEYTARECDFAYNATQMALQWDMLATGDTRVMLEAQHELLRKPYGTSWITYTRCHDDIGLGYDDYMISDVGFSPFEHRKFLKDYYSGNYEGSPARGALFSSNPKTGDARISGSLASLCGLEKALEKKDEKAIEISIQKILMMQAHSFFLGGLPMIFYGDEAACTNDYSYLNEPGKSYDNRWMHRPLIDWEKNKRVDKKGTVEHKVFSGTQKLLALRKQLPMVADQSNLTWMAPHNIHVAGYIREKDGKRLYCLSNFRPLNSWLTWYAFKEHGIKPTRLYDHWSGKYFDVGNDHEYFILEPYGFYLLEAVE
ncbi:MAG: alpha-amylase [Chitinophagaceae bacterium]|nr:MAG: alpha-amylase [Chitinophagaceae bacterium]